jgi:hypothetical protein
LEFYPLLDEQRSTSAASRICTASCGPIVDDVCYPIHRPAPALVDQAVEPSPFETGIKSST